MGSNQKTYLAKDERSSQNLGVDPFPDLVGYLGLPGGHFGFFRFSCKGLEGVQESKNYFAKDNGSTQKPRGTPLSTPPHRMVPDGILWYRLVPNGTEWYYMVLHGTERYKMVPKGTKWYQMVPIGTKWYRMVLNGTVCY